MRIPPSDWLSVQSSLRPALFKYLYKLFVPNQPTRVVLGVPLPEKKSPAHELVPKHSILSQAEAEKVLSEFRVSRLQIPKIKVKDAALEGMGAKAGQMVKVDREDGSVNYRLVI
jgi:DNA-directed RNA polymerase subunit H (RpoH/RPB5)